MPRLIIHRQGIPQPEIIEPADGESVAELVGAKKGEVEVFLEDGEEALDLSAAVEAIGAIDGSQLLVAKPIHTQISATVEYNTQPETKSWQPQQKVRRVYSWAVGKKGFELPADQRPEHELALPGHTEPVDLDSPIAAYAGPDHRVTFVMRRKDSFQG